MIHTMLQGFIEPLEGAFSSLIIYALDTDVITIIGYSISRLSRAGDTHSQLTFGLMVFFAMR